MKLLFLGDVMGRAGRDAVATHLPELRRSLSLDFVAANCENAAHGFGITPAICADFFNAGIDCITLGNHAWDQREIIPFIDGEPRLLRPRNFPAGTPGRGAGQYRTERSKNVVVISVIGRLFMDPIVDDPFAALEAELAKTRLGSAADAIIVDVHCEASSEKMALAQIADGRASAVIGSHTHVPTADSQILARGTAYQTDAGMCGDYDSVIGMKKEVATARFMRKISAERLSPADGEGTLCAVFVETDDTTGLARRIAPVRIGGRLASARPE